MKTVSPSSRRHGRGNVQRTDEARRVLHEGLDVIRRLHCDRKDEPGHHCIGKMTVHAGGIDLDCTRCGSMDIRNDEQLALDAFENALRGAADLIPREEDRNV